ncbi:TNF receptor-associated factor 6-like [Montipora capricornis]|uniref:TNF receptor-associated factor 6-like n=1 Tax=Montipora capricornis TaxID=246305 RepID=UPI0035F1EFC0
MAEQQGAFGGYDEEFLHDIEHDWLCPICHHPLKNPVQTRVCGHRFCEVCLERHFMRQEGDGQLLSCPLDQNVLRRNKDIFLDKATERKVRSFIIKCPRGCQWTGELRSKEAHFNECRRLPVNCPNGCGEVIPREEILSHTADHCSLRPIPCPYAEMGCIKKVPQTEIEAHLHLATQRHLSLVCKKLRNQEDELRWAYTTLKNTTEELLSTKKHVKDLKETTKKLEERIYNMENKPFIYTWNINGFHNIVQQLTSGYAFKIESEPFYTGECGYQVRLCLLPNGVSFSGIPHWSFYLIIMKGDYDSSLKWPFHKQVTFSLIKNQQDDMENFTTTIVGNQPEQAWNSRPCVVNNIAVSSYPIIVPHGELMKCCQTLNYGTIFVKAKFETVV